MRSTLRTLFDIKPVDATGAVDVRKMQSLSPRIDLRAKKLQREINLVIHRRVKRAGQPSVVFEAPLTKSKVLAELEEAINTPATHRATLAQWKAIARTPVNPFDATQARILRELRSPLPAPSELKPPPPSLGGQGEPPAQTEVPAVMVAEPEPISEPQPIGPEITPVLARQNFPEENLGGLAEAPWVQQPVLEDWYFAAPPTAERLDNSLIGKIRRWPASFSRRKKITLVVIAGILLASGAGGYYFKFRITQNGAHAVQNLENAKENLENFNFTAAADDFFKAYQEFTQAGEQLNFMGASLTSLLGELPGGEKIKSAENLLEAGKLIANSGQAMSDSLQVLGKMGLLLNPTTGSKVFLSEVIAPLRSGLTISQKNLEQVATLLAVIDASTIPGDKQEQFVDFNNRLPEFRDLVNRGVEYANFLERLIGSRGEKKYLVLFQNYSELRPTGGFPGSYGVLIFENGRLKEMKVDDVYNIDGQLKELVVPPKELQHITPTWAMRDSAWFIDFPTSAEKVLGFYKKEAKQELDGVITLSPDSVADILKVIGPIALPEYDLVLTHENFLPEIQAEVEYGENKKINKPKKILTDLTPILINKLSKADKAQWLEIVNMLMAGIGRKEILMYFKEDKLQEFARAEGFSGGVKSTKDDYLMVTFSNIKGSKTDAVTNTAYRLDTILEENVARHTLSITRTHTGGKSKYGFYNKQNPAYVRMLVPANATLVKATGQATPNFQPLISYARNDFHQDPDLVALTLGARTENSVQIFGEAGKQEFGFWLIVDPGQTQTVIIEYTVPVEQKNAYTLDVQKQPGLRVREFIWNVDADYPRTVYQGELDKDLQLRLQVR